MTIEEIQAHPLYIQLTPKQQAFVTAYISTQDGISSIRAAGYGCQLDKTADMMARKNLKHPLIKQLIASALGYESTGGMLSKKDVLLLMSEHLRTTKDTTTFARLSLLFADIQGWVNKNETPDITQAVLMLERKRKKEANAQRTNG